MVRITAECDGDVCRGDSMSVVIFIVMVMVMAGDNGDDDGGMGF